MPRHPETSPRDLVWCIHRVVMILYGVPVNSNDPKTIEPTVYYRTRRRGALESTAMPTPCHKLTFEEAVAIQLRLMDGEFYSRIARDYDVNQGRIADVKFHRLHPSSYAEALKRKSSAA